MSSSDRSALASESCDRPASADGAASRVTPTIDPIREQAKFGHQAWLERLREMQDVEAEFAKELSANKDPKIALRVCNRRIAKRLEPLTADSKAFAGFCMDLVMTAAGSAASTSAPGQKGDDV